MQRYIHTPELFSLTLMEGVRNCIPLMKMSGGDEIQLISSHESLDVKHLLYLHIMYLQLYLNVFVAYYSRSSHTTHDYISILMLVLCRIAIFSALDTLHEEICFKGEGDPIPLGPGILHFASHPPFPHQPYTQFTTLALLAHALQET